MLPLEAMLDDLGLASSGYLSHYLDLIDRKGCRGRSSARENQDLNELKAGCSSINQSHKTQ